MFFERKREVGDKPGEGIRWGIRGRVWGGETWPGGERGEVLGIDITQSEVAGPGGREGLGSPDVRELIANDADVRNNLLEVGRVAKECAG